MTDPTLTSGTCPGPFAGTFVAIWHAVYGTMRPRARRRKP